MPRKKPAPEHENHERWLVSYADFITLLFAFFVVMFASSQTDKAKVQQVSDSVKEALAKGGVAAAVHEILGGTVDERGKGNAQMKGPGGSEPKNVPNPPPQPQDKELLPKMKYLSDILKKEIGEGKLEIKQEARGLVIHMQDAAFFPSGDDTVAPERVAAIGKIAAALKDSPNPIRLEGHTDSIPIHTARFRSNWELSAARAITVLELFATRYKIPRERFAIAGYADTAPKDSNETEEGRAHNRRVDIVILNQRVLMNQPPSAEPVPAAPPQKPSAMPQKPAATPPGKPK